MEKNYSRPARHAKNHLSVRSLMEETTEKVKVENKGASKVQEWKMQEWK